MNIIQATAFEYEGHAITLLSYGRTRCNIVDDVAYIFKPSSSSYGMTTPDGSRHQFVCQDGCCDRGLQQDVADIAEAAKELGAHKLVLRTGQREYRCAKIAGLPVEDVSGHVGTIADGLVIDQRR